jgi:AcrR family transcriptional regulator
MAPREADRQAQILDIARRLFAEQGFAGTSLRDIATEAGITKAALYHHFPNKDALYEQVVVEGGRSLLEAVEAAVAAADTPVDRVRAFMCASADYFEVHRFQWLAGSNAFWQGRDVDHRTAAVELRDAYEALLRRCIAEGIAAGELRAQVEPAMAGRLLLSALSHLARWHKPDGKLSARQAIGQFVDMALLGIAMPKSDRKPTEPSQAIRSSEDFPCNYPGR